MKSICKLVLVVFLFTSAAFADGDLPNGNKNCPNGQTTCLVDSGSEETKPTEPTDSTDSILIFVQEYFDSMVEYFEN